tara:strand:- start:6490 stop:6888 length:399 start_codon:yes stop_codon:yes gene_type:complete
LSDIIPTLGYIPAMQISIRSLALFACLCLLALQMSGLHLHIETDNDSANLHGTHLHQAENHGQDHSADIDVSLVEELRINWTQLIPLILACAILLIAKGWLQQRLWLPLVQFVKLCRRSHWRPPLRAPPTLY